MTILKLYKHYKLNTLHSFLETLDIKTLKLLLQQMKIEKIRYKAATKNYDEIQTKKYSTPALKRINMIIYSLKQEIKDR